MILGVFIIRIGLPLSMIILGIWAHIRISISLRKRLELPADMKAKVSAFEHQVTELDESLTRHVGKHTSREAREQKAAQKRAAEAAAMAPEAVAGIPTAAVQADIEYMPSHIWNKASPAQQTAWEASGLRCAG